MDLKEYADHSYGTDCGHKDEAMKEASNTNPYTGVREFSREDGATVQCVIAEDTLELVIVEFADGGRVEIEPTFVDFEMLRRGLGDELVATLH